MTSQVVYLASDVDPTPVIVAMLAEWGEVTAERFDVDPSTPGTDWRWRIVGNYRTAKQP
jgi:hypothetical protein